MNNILPKLIVIVGPTASGKTALGIEIAKRFDGEVVSVDSRQVYRGMNIGTAKSEGEWVERKRFLVDGIPHWGVDLIEPDVEYYSVAEFKKYAEKKIDEILSRKKLPILVGGTGLWIAAIIDNLEIPPVAADHALRGELEKKSLGDLYAEFKRLDPVGAEVIDRDNKRRLVRALEVTKSAGEPFSQLQRKGSPRYQTLQLGQDIPRLQINERIDDRVDRMVARGLVDEVRALKEKYGCETHAMSGIGYRQICDFLDGKEKLERAIEKVKLATKQYAKRQMTWFKRDARIAWVGTSEAAIPIVERFLQEP